MTPTPLQTGDSGVFTVPGAAAEAVVLMIAECRAWGALGFDLEWAPDGRITWIGIGTAIRAISLWRPTLPESVMVALREAVADPLLVKIAHNCQADIQRWEVEEGPVGGLWEDSMLAHHAAFPGLAHDLQNVVAQFCVVPPWKVWHKDAQEASKARDKEFKQAEKVAVKAATKIVKEQGKVQDKNDKAIVKAHAKAATKIEIFLKTYPMTPVVQEALDAVLAETVTGPQLDMRLDTLCNFAVPREMERIKAERKAERVAAHEASNAALKADKIARKTPKRGSVPVPEASAETRQIELAIVSVVPVVPDAPAEAPENVYNFPRVAMHNSGRAPVVSLRDLLSNAAVEDTENPNDDTNT